MHMKKVSWQLAIIFLAGLVVGILLLSEQSVESNPITTPEPVRGGNYTEALVGSLQRLNPLLDYYNQTDRDINRLIFSQLVRFDERGIPNPELAANWGVSEDGTVYNLVLQEGAKWHDGQPVTAQDVVFTVEMLRSDNDVVPADLQEFWDTVEVEALDETHLQFRLPEPFSPFIDYLTFGVIPEHLLGDQTFDQMIDAGFNIEPVGSGPYRFGGVIADDGVIQGVQLVAYEDYFGEKPFIQEIIFRFYPDGQSALQAYREGLVQGIQSIGEDILPDVLAEEGLSVYTGRRPELALVMFNLKNPEYAFLQDSDLRQALLQGLNRQYMVDRVLNGQAIIANGVIFPETWAYYEETPQVAFDREAAKEALSQAGYKIDEETGIRSKDGVVLRFTLLHPDTDTHRRIAEVIQDNWLELGVDVALQAVPYDELISDYLETRSFQAVLVDLNLSRSPDPDPYPFWDQVQATGGQNYSQWDNRIASEYLEQARTETDMAERTRIYRSFQVVFAREMPALPLYYPVYTYAVDRAVGGVQMGPLFDPSDRFATVLEWHLATRTGEAAQAKASPAP